jgi:hypothetical protein
MRTDKIKIKTKDGIFNNDDVDILNGVCRHTYDKLLSYNLFYIVYAPEMLEEIK